MNLKDDSRKLKETGHYEELGIETKEQAPAQGEKTENSQKKAYYLLSNFKSMKASTLRSPDPQNPSPSLPFAPSKKIDKPIHALNNKKPEPSEVHQRNVNKTALDCRLSFKATPSPKEHAFVGEPNQTPQISPTEAIKKSNHGFKISPKDRKEIPQNNQKHKLAQHLGQTHGSTISIGLKQLLSGTNIANDNYGEKPNSSVNPLLSGFSNASSNLVTSKLTLNDLKEPIHNCSPILPSNKSTLANQKVSLTSLKQNVAPIKSNLLIFPPLAQPVNRSDIESEGSDQNETFNSLVTHPDIHQANNNISDEKKKIRLRENKTSFQKARASKKGSKRSLSSDEESSVSSGRKSDEKLCRAFSVERSLTITAKANSVHISESIDNDPDFERSMRLEETRTLSFLNEDEEALEKLHHGSKNNLKKNKLQNTSLKFSATKKFSLCENKPSINPLLTVISNISGSQPPLLPIYCQNPVYSSGKLSHKESSMFSTQDSRPGHNRSQNQEPTYTRDVFSDNKLDAAIQEPLSYHLLSSFDPNLSEDRRKTRTRKCQPVTDSQSFDIKVDSIFGCAKTTLMIKNIPNRYTKEMMLETIDKRFKDTYDFFYLPIDFDNNCNVGYAFINFVDVGFIEGFYTEFNGIHWPNFKSDKICEITYARIQGKDDCNQHFKDSSLMKQEVS